MMRVSWAAALGLIVIVAALSFALVFFSFRQGALRTGTAPVPAAQPTAQPTQNQGKEGDFFTQLFATDESAPEAQNGDWKERALKIVLRLFLAVLLTALLAFRPRKDVPLLQRNLYVAQTQILLSVVAAALMMIVGDNAARAFAIFAAVSLVRFRTNIRDPKEITVLLISLAIGLATGVGRWELAVILCLFVLPLLWLLEYKEPEQAFRAMQLTVKTRNVDTTQDALKEIFNRHKLETEIRQLNPPDETSPIGYIMYFLNLRLSISTDRLNDQIFAADANNIEGIEWEQEKNAAVVYQ